MFTFTKSPLSSVYKVQMNFSLNYSRHRRCRRLFYSTLKWRIVATEKAGWIFIHKWARGEGGWWSNLLDQCFVLRSRRGYFLFGTDYLPNYWRYGLRRNLFQLTVYRCWRVRDNLKSIASFFWFKLKSVKGGRDTYNSYSYRNLKLYCWTRLLQWQ
jgi:hypothetical protein